MKKARFQTGVRAGLALLCCAVAARAEIVIGPAQITIRATDRTPPAGGGSDAPARPSGGGPGDRLILLNGDQVSGALERFGDAPARLWWRHPGTEQAIPFLPSFAAEVQLAARDDAPAVEADTLLYLVNGDQLEGAIERIDGETVLLRTAYAGPLSVRRSAVDSVHPNLRGAGVLFTGPNRLDEWKIMAGREANWQLRDGWLFPQQSVPIGREIENMPDAVSIEFTLNVRPNAHFTMWVFSQRPEQQDNSDSYFLQMHGGGRIDLHRQAQNEGSTSLGQAQFPAMRGGGTFRYQLLLDRQKRQMALLIDGTLVQEWSDPREFRGTGSGLTFMSHQPGTWRLSNIRVSGWTGRIPTKAPDARADLDTLTFVNGDVLSGRLSGLTDGVFKLETAFAPMEIPIERVVDLTFASGSRVQPARREGSVRAHFVRSGTLTLFGKAIEDGRLFGEAGHLGEIEVPLSAFSRIEFNLDAERADADPAW